MARTPYFTEDLRFTRHGADKVTGEDMVRVVDVGTAPERDIGSILKASTSRGGEDRGLVLQLRTLLDKCLELDPAKRMTPHDALLEPFMKFGVGVGWKPART